MAHHVTERPNAYCLSRNEIRYVFSVDELSRAGLYLEAQLAYKIPTGKAKINWSVGQVAIDSNLFIFQNTVNIRSAFIAGSGTELVNGGDAITLIAPIYDLPTWATGTPYQKMRVFKNGAEIYNQFSHSTADADWLTYNFIAEADAIYTVVVYAKDESDLPHTDEIEVEFEDPFRTLTPWKLKPNADGTVYLPIQQYIESLLEYILPAGNITNASAQACIFFIKSREIDDDHPNPDYSLAEKVHTRLAIKAGIEKHRYSRNNFFANYFDTQKPWLTWRPSNRMIWPGEPQYLTAFFKNGTASGLTLRVKYRTTAGVDAEINIALTSIGYLIHFKVDIATLGVPAGQLYYYEVGILNGADIVVAFHRFYINYDPLYKYHDIIAINSLGGIDTIRATGEVNNGLDRNAEDSEGGFSLSEWSDTIKSHESAQAAITYRRTYKGDIGHQRTIREQESLIEILLSRRLYQIIDSRFVPIIINQRNQALGKSTDKLVSFPLEWALSEANETYTPADIALGLGADTEEY
ncbi:MAG: hypothetical protein JO301_17030 [Chitinophagaceae bacterium]|nr:hypothetical protein [Chitinophagaceae bacterium]